MDKIGTSDLLLSGNKDGGNIRDKHSQRRCYNTQKLREKSIGPDVIHPRVLNERRIANEGAVTNCNL